MKSHAFRHTLTVLSVACALSAPAYGEEDTNEPVQNPHELIGLNPQISAQYSGQGVNLGVVDSGFMLEHPQLNRDKIHALILEVEEKGEKIRIDPRRYDTEMEKDEQGKKHKVYAMHGGQVSGIIGAKSLPQVGYYGGVAKGSQLYVAQYEPNGDRDDDEENNDKRQNRHLAGGQSNTQDDALLFGKDAEGQRVLLAAALQKVAQHNVLAINNSWNEDAVDNSAQELDKRYQNPIRHQGDKNRLIDAIRQTAKRGVFLVFAAGNENKQQPGILAALPRYLPELESHYLSVVAVDKNKRITSYSNRCGVSKNWCIAAPGDLTVLSTGGAEQGQKIPNLQNQSGTSFAAPTVTGSLAVLKQRFDYFTPTQVRDTLLTTATDLGKKGVDEQYGWGLVNLSKAIRGPAALLRDETYRLNRDDSWSNTLTTEFALTKTGEATLTLNGANNRIRTLNINQGKLVLNGATSADNVNNHAALGVNALTVNRAFLADRNSRLDMLSAQGITAQGKHTRVTLDGALSAAESLLQNRKAGQTISRILTVKNGATYQGGFSNVSQSAVLFQQGLRQDLYFKADGIELKANKNQAISDPNADVNGQSGLRLLNALRDGKMAWRRGIYNDWLQQALENHNLQHFHYAVSNGIYADSIEFLRHRFSAQLNQSGTHLRYRDAALHQLNVWAQSQGDNYRSDNSPAAQKAEFETHGSGLGLAYKADDKLLLSARFGHAKSDIRKQQADATLKQRHAGVALRYMPASNGWFAELSADLAHIYYRQQRTFNGKTLAAGNTKGWLSGAELRGGYGLPSRNWRVEPTVGVQLVHTHLNALQESGEFALSTARFNRTDVNLVSGLRLNKTLELSGWRITPDIALDYAYRLNGGKTKLHSTFDTITLDSQATSFGQDGLDFGAGAQLARNGWSIGLELKQRLFQRGKGTTLNGRIGFSF
ncbi:MULTISPECIES: S8 family serine peptidase [Pasteurellaceae]|uniref:S8 family serine peptidase n=1 Tax=Pasteurellaceae TaxID=712 RepID=UPI003566166E